MLTYVKEWEEIRSKYKMKVGEPRWKESIRQKGLLKGQRIYAFMAGFLSTRLTSSLKMNKIRNPNQEWRFLMLRANFLYVEPQNIYKSSVWTSDS
jgi:hypothetical protein